MKIMYCEREFDTDKISKYTDIVDYLENIEVVDTIDTKGTRYKPIDEKMFSKFDFLTGKEKAQISLQIALTVAAGNLQKDLYSANAEIVDSLIKMLDPERKIEQKPIEVDKWTQYNQLKILTTIVSDYISFNLYNRLGFDIFLAYDVDGQISTIKDLRNVFSAELTF